MGSNGSKDRQDDIRWHHTHIQDGARAVVQQVRYGERSYGSRAAWAKAKREGLETDPHWHPEDLWVHKAYNHDLADIIERITDEQAATLRRLVARMGRKSNSTASRVAAAEEAERLLEALGGFKRAIAEEQASFDREYERQEPIYDLASDHDLMDFPDYGDEWEVRPKGLRWWTTLRAKDGRPVESKKPATRIDLLEMEDLGVLDEERRLTAAGRDLLEILDEHCVAYE